MASWAGLLFCCVSDHSWCPLCKLPSSYFWCRKPTCYTHNFPRAGKVQISVMSKTRKITEQHPKEGIWWFPHQEPDPVMSAEKRTSHMQTQQLLTAPVGCMQASNTFCFISFKVAAHQLVLLVQPEGPLLVCVLTKTCRKRPWLKLTQN